VSAAEIERVMKELERELWARARDENGEVSPYTPVTAPAKPAPKHKAPKRAAVGARSKLEPRGESGEGGTRAGCLTPTAAREIGKRLRVIQSPNAGRRRTLRRAKASARPPSNVAE
jgi:hypothetical protein